MSGFYTTQFCLAQLDHLTQVPAGSYSVTLLDQTGRVLSTQQLAGGASHTLNVQHLPVGAYIVVVDGNALHLSKRLL